MVALEREVTAWDGVASSAHRGRGQFRSGGREFAHLHGCGLLDIRLGMDLARRCLSEGKAEPHHVLGPSAWVSFWLRDDSRIPDALALLRLARDQGTAQRDRSSVEHSQTNRIHPWP
ncbi:MAG: DUF5519 family protein [Verrucomicrobiae bacterium]|nr:DUF5519 family protein [Verrucomicrobiae bacterium]